MQGYISKQTRWVKMETLVCDHPKVWKVWFTGSMSMHGVPPSTILTLNILLKNGARNQFESENVQEGADELIVRAEEYLQLLPIE